MALLGTSTADPNFYQRKMGALGETLSGLAQVFERRRAEKRQKQQAEIESFLTAASNNPELAATWGQDLKTRYGKDNPGLAPLVDLLANRHQKLQEVQQAGQAWTGTWDQIDREFKAKQAATAKMPDQQTIFTPFGTVFGDVPNQEKTRAQQELAQRNPQMFGLEALQQLSPSQRLAAQVYAKANGYEMPQAPTQFDPYKHLPESARWGYAAAQGQLPPEVTEAWRYSAELETSPADQNYMGFQAKQATEKERAEREAEQRKHDNSMSQLTERERLAAIRQQRHFAGMAGLENLRASNNPKDPKAPSSDIGGKGGINWKSFQAEHKALVEDYDSRRRTHLGLEANPSKKDRANKEFVENNGRRPAPLTESYARQMQKNLRQRIDAGEVSEADASAEMARMIREWSTLTARGAAPEKALRQVAPVTAPATPLRGGTGNRSEVKSRLSASIKDPEVRAWAEGEFERGVASGQDPNKLFQMITAKLRERGKKP